MKIQLLHEPKCEVHAWPLFFLSSRVRSTSGDRRTIPRSETHELGCVILEFVLFNYTFAKIKLDSHSKKCYWQVVVAAILLNTHAFRALPLSSVRTTSDNRKPIIRSENHELSGVISAFVSNYTLAKMKIGFYSKKWAHSQLTQWTHVLLWYSTTAEDSKRYTDFGFRLLMSAYNDWKWKINDHVG